MNRWWMCLVAASVWTACGGSDGTGDKDGSGGRDVDSDAIDTEQWTTYDTVRPLFVTTCATSGCHDGTQAPNMSDGGAGALVGVQAQQVRMPYIDPGYLDTSYLVYKLRGAQQAAGGSGQQMPLGGVFSDEDLALVEAWVLSGAPE